MPRRVVVVGSGPAGLWAARYACENGAEVTVLEARRKVGSKLLISGAGKCNYTNILSARDQAERLFRPQLKIAFYMLLYFLSRCLFFGSETK